MLVLFATDAFVCVIRIHGLVPNNTACQALQSRVLLPCCFAILQIEGVCSKYGFRLQEDAYYLQVIKNLNIPLLADQTKVACG